jgi:hypothetical protein
MDGTAKTTLLTLAAGSLLVLLCGPLTALAKDSPENVMGIADMAVDGAGRLWLADGVACTGGTTGALWVSADHGDTWRPVAIGTADGERMTTAPASVEVEGKQMLTRSKSCCDADGCLGGELFLSYDGGTNWTMMVMDEMLPLNEPEDEGAGVTGTWWKGTKLDHFIVEVGGVGAFITDDGGDRWEKVDRESGLPSFRKGYIPDHGQASLKVGECSFHAGVKGLTRRCGSGPESPPVFPNDFVRKGPVWHITRLVGQIVGARIIDPATGKTLSGFEPAQVVRLGYVLKRGTPSAGWVATTPPWPNPIVLTAVSGEELAIHFVNTAVRVNLLDSMVGGAGAGNPNWEINAADLDLEYEDGEWLWGVLGSTLGSTKVKEYMSIPMDKGFPGKPGK